MLAGPLSETGRLLIFAVAAGGDTRDPERQDRIQPRADAMSFICEPLSPTLGIDAPGLESFNGSYQDCAAGVGSVKV